MQIQDRHCKHHELSTAASPEAEVLPTLPAENLQENDEDHTSAVHEVAANKLNEGGEGHVSDVHEELQTLLLHSSKSKSTKMTTRWPTVLG